jgi:hypothetical protein
LLYQLSYLGTAGAYRDESAPCPAHPPQSRTANRCHWIALPAERNLNLMGERLQLLIAERDIHARIAALARDIEPITAANGSASSSC